ncbi:MAG: 4Fe-4S dicluster domain-containing protein [Promethearchaeota archaeon]
MTQKALVFESKKCIGCRLCEQICSMTHFQVTNPAKSRIRIFRNDREQVDWAVYCRSCPDPECIKACYYEALSRDPETNAIMVNEDNCVGCGECIDKCPYSHPIMHPSENYILICDLCGGNPECVEICPENAIQYAETENQEEESNV